MGKPAPDTHRNAKGCIWQQVMCTRVYWDTLRLGRVDTVVPYCKVACQSRLVGVHARQLLLQTLRRSQDVARPCGLAADSTAIYDLQPPVALLRYYGASSEPPANTSEQCVVQISPGQSHKHRSP